MLVTLLGCVLGAALGLPLGYLVYRAVADAGGLLDE